MPILNDILDHKVLGREFKRGRQEGLEEGRQEGLEEGRQEGRQEGELSLLRSQIEKRFGPLPASAERELARRSGQELSDLGLRLLDVNSLEELFK